MLLALEAVAWWAAAVGIWVASLSAYSSQDLVVAMGCAVPTAAVAVAARRAVGGAWRFPGETLRWLALLPWSIVRDAVTVLALPVRRGQTGVFRTVDLGSAGTSAPAAGREAAASVVLSATPGSFVVATDRRPGTALLHAVGDPTALERAVTR